MKNIILLALISMSLFSCSNEEGEGGSSNIEGHVYTIAVNDDLSRDTFPANDQRVQIIYGNKKGYDDAKTAGDGWYQFKYLREGNYTIYAYTDMPSGEQKAVGREVQVNGSDNVTVPDIYIEDGKAVGTYYIVGNVLVNYIKKNSTTLVMADSVEAKDMRVFLEKATDVSFLEDVRTKEDGTFVFSRLNAGSYKVWVVYEKPDETLSSVSRTFELKEDGTIVLGELKVNGSVVNEIETPEATNSVGTLVTRINV